MRRYGISLLHDETALKKIDKCFTFFALKHSNVCIGYAPSV